MHLPILSFSQHTKAALWIILSIILASTGNGFVHFLVQKLSPLHIMLFKSGITFCILMSIFFIKNNKISYRSHHKKYHILRGCVGFIGVYFWIAALKHLSLAEASALSLTSAFATAIGGYIIFKETMTWQKNVSLLLGALGVLVILKPGLSFQMELLYPLYSAIAFAISALVSKHLSRFDSTTLITLSLSAIMTILTLCCISWDHLIPKNPMDIGILTIIGVAYATSQLCFVQGYKYGEASFLAPFKFLKFPLYTLWGLLFFTETPHITTFIGAGLIILACYLLMKSKSHSKSQPKSKSRPKL